MRGFGRVRSCELVEPRGRASRHKRCWPTARCCSRRRRERFAASTSATAASERGRPCLAVRRRTGHREHARPRAWSSSFLSPFGPAGPIFSPPTFPNYERPADSSLCTVQDTSLPTTELARAAYTGDCRRTQVKARRQRLAWRMSILWRLGGIPPFPARADNFLWKTGPAPVGGARPRRRRELPIPAYDGQNPTETTGSGVGTANLRSSGAVGPGAPGCTGAWSGAGSCTWWYR